MRVDKISPKKNQVIYFNYWEHDDPQTTEFPEKKQRSISSSPDIYLHTLDNKLGNSKLTMIAVYGTTR